MLVHVVITGIGISQDIGSPGINVGYTYTPVTEPEPPVFYGGGVVIPFPTTGHSIQDVAVDAIVADLASGGFEPYRIVFLDLTVLKP